MKMKRRITQLSAVVRKLHELRHLSILFGRLGDKRMIACDGHSTIGHSTPRACKLLSPNNNQLTS